MKKNLNDFLVLISSDHHSFDFPLSLIQKELTIMYLDKDDFDDGLMRAFHKIKRKHGEVLANIFLTITDFKLKIRTIEFRNMNDEQYQNWLDAYFDTLSKVKITRIEKKTPDGMMLEQMASK